MLGAGGGLEASCAQSYAEDLLEAVEWLPAELQPHLSAIRALDAEYLGLLRELRRLTSELGGLARSSPRRAALVARTKALLWRGQTLGDRKLRHATALSDRADQELARLDADARYFQPLQRAEPSASKLSLLGPARQPRNGLADDLKRPRRQKQFPDFVRDAEDAAAAAASTASANGRASAGPGKRDKPSPPDHSPKDSPPPPPPPPPPKKARKTTTPAPAAAAPAVAKEAGAGPARKKSGAKGAGKAEAKAEAKDEERRYCLCDQVSYGEMIGCDFDGCSLEWFHFDCVQLSSKPKGRWYCPNCRGDRPNLLKPRLK